VWAGEGACSLRAAKCGLQLGARRVGAVHQLFQASERRLPRSHLLLLLGHRRRRRRRPLARLAQLLEGRLGRAHRLLRHARLVSFLLRSPDLLLVRRRHRLGEAHLRLRAPRRRRRFAPRLVLAPLALERRRRRRLLLGAPHCRRALLRRLAPPLLRRRLAPLGRRKRRRLLERHRRPLEFNEAHQRVAQPAVRLVYAVHMRCACSAYSVHARVHAHAHAHAHVMHVHMHMHMRTFGQSGASLAHLSASLSATSYRSSLAWVVRGSGIGNSRGG